MEKRQTCDLAGIWRFEIDKEDRGIVSRRAYSYALH